MKRLFSLLLFPSLLLFYGCTPSDILQPGEGVSVSFTLEAGGATRATTALPQDSTVRVIAYRQAQGQTGYPETSRAGECTYRMTAAGLVPCAVRPDGTADPSGTSLGDMELAPGAYTFYTISPALRVYHEAANPMVAVNHGVDFGVSVTSYTVTAGVNRVTLAPLARKCCRLRFLTDRNGAFSGITKLRVQSLTLEEMSNQPVWMTGTQSFELPGNAYSSTVRIGKEAFKVPAGNADFQQVAEVNCLPRAKKDFRLRVSVLYNNDTTPTVLETTVKTTEFAQGSLNVFSLTFGKGTIEVKQEENWEETEMGDHIGAQDLNAGGATANCYLITDNTMKTYSFNARVRGNGYDFPLDPNVSSINYSTLPDLSTATEARVIWQTGGWGAVVRQASLVNGKVFFTTGPAKEGNAVIGIFASSDTTAPCLWSWHIWKVDGALPPDVVCLKFKGGIDLNDPIPIKTGPVTPYQMMSLNLGAYTNRIDDNGTIGLEYQWGRKDPFPGPADFSGREPDIYGSFNDGSVTGIWNGPYQCKTTPRTVGGTEAWAVKYPTILISMVQLSDGGDGGDWMNVRNGYLWGTPWTPNGIAWSYNANQGVKSIYDPCPVGYRVPPCDVASKQKQIKTLTTSKGSIPQELSDEIWFSWQGYRNGELGFLVNLMYETFYWENSYSYLVLKSPPHPSDIRYCGATWTIKAHDKQCGANAMLANAHAAPIRCIKE